jgi:tetratricopeptide (TPR) repeat protein
MQKVNYYEELKLDPNSTLESLQFAVNKKLKDEEKDSFSDGHEERLALLKEAQKAFASESARKKYDESLRATTGALTDEKKAIYEKWLPSVYHYYFLEHYDIARTAFENALSGGNPDLENADVFSFASLIYEKNGDFEKALEYANKAIVAEQTVAEHLVRKAEVCSTCELFRDGRVRAGLIAKEKQTLELGESVAQDADDNEALAEVYDHMAFVYFMRENGDENKAERFARLSLDLDASKRNAKDVLAEILNHRNDSKIAEIEGKRKAVENTAKAIEKNKKQQKDVERAGKLKKAALICAAIGVPALAAFGAGVIVLIVAYCLSKKSKSLIGRTYNKSVLSAILQEEKKLRKELVEDTNALRKALQSYKAFAEDYDQLNQKTKLRIKGKINRDYIRHCSDPHLGMAAVLQTQTEVAVVRSIASDSGDGWACPCGKTNPAGSVFCSACGKSVSYAQAHLPVAAPPVTPYTAPEALPAATAVQPETASAAVALADSPQATLCKNCGAALREGAKFCRECGSAQ